MLAIRRPPDIRILHVTDLHAEKHYTPTGETNRRWWIRAIQNLAKGRPFDAVACAGDIGRLGDPHSIQTGWNLLKEVQEAANPAGASLIISPGNHDAGRQPFDSDSNWPFQERFKAYINTVFSNAATAPFGPIEFQTAADKQLWVSPGNRLQILPISSASLSGAVPPPNSDDEVDLFLKQLKTHRKEVSFQFKDGTGISPQRLIERIRRYRLAEMPIAGGPRGLSEQGTLLSTAPAMLRVALIHHPLWPVTRRDIPQDPLHVTLDGMSTVAWLQENGFQLVLHGHKHFLGCCLLKGHLGCDDQPPYDLFETVALSGGCIGDNIPGAGVPGFQFLDFWFDEHDRRAELLVSQATQAAVEDNERVVCHCVFKLAAPITNSARMRWFRIPSQTLSRHISTSQGYQLWKNWPPEAEWKRHIADVVIQDLKADMLVAAAENVYEQKFTTIKPEPLAFERRSSIEQTDTVLQVSIQALREQYQEGDRGVTQQFIADIRGRAHESRAMLFIDVEGNGTWGDPDLIEHTSELFRIYQEVNAGVLGNLRQSTSNAGGAPVQPSRPWRNQIPQMEKAIANKLRYRPVDLLGDPNLTEQIPEEAQDLGFSLARILVWRAESFHAASAQVLLRLHKVSQVPVFFVPKDTLTGSLESVKDMHFEWPTSKTEPLQCYPYIDRKRREAVSKRESRAQWLTAQGLLEIAQNPFDLPEVQTNSNQGDEP